MSEYLKGIFTGILLSTSFVLFMASTSEIKNQNNNLVQKLNDIDLKIDFNYNVLNKHLVRIMAYGVKVKEGHIDSVRQPVVCSESK